MGYIQKIMVNNQVMFLTCCLSMQASVNFVSLTCSCNYGCSVLSLKEADGEGYVEGEYELATKTVSVVIS